VALGGWMMLHTSPKMKKFVKNSLSQIKKTVDDSSRVEKNWVRIYQNSKNSKFYTTVRKITDTLPKSEFALEHGCSIGLISAYLAKNHTTVFGIDSSYSSILHAKKSKKQNLDFFVADSLEHPFGSKKFGLVVALNLLELVEPTKLLKTISTQIQNGTVLFSDPYDYERGINSVKNPIFENEIRNKLIHLGFSISPLTKKPSFIQWNLNLNSRASLYYKVDLILGKKN
jgi:2-polyprenyl-3-methyl-5-hydroxy-6-metoxy-1,4-benzoquinol methylase